MPIAGPDFLKQLKTDIPQSLVPAEQQIEVPPNNDELRQVAAILELAKTTTPVEVALAPGKTDQVLQKIDKLGTKIFGD